MHLLLASQRLEEGRLRGLETQLSYRIGLRTFSAAESRIVLGCPGRLRAAAAARATATCKTGTDDMIRFKAAYVSGPAVGEPAAADTRAGRHAVMADVVPFGPAWVEPRAHPVGSSADEPVHHRAPRRPRELSQTLLDVVVAQLAGQGPAAHQIWLPPLDVPATLGPAAAAAGR